MRILGKSRFCPGKIGSRPISSRRHCAKSPNEAAQRRQALACLGEYFRTRFADSPFVVVHQGQKQIATYAGKDRMVIIFATSSHHLRSPLAECEGVAETDDATIFFTLVDHLAHAPDEATHLNLRKIMGKGAVLDFSTKRVLREINCWGRRAMLGIIEVRLASAAEFSLGFDFRKQEARFLQEHSDYFRGR